ncbi:MAG: CPBP family intramembrane glutamic endopeptidase [Parvularculaceae bacterium]
MIIFWGIAFAIAWALTVPTALAQLGYIDASPIPAGLGNFIGVAPAIAALVAAAMSGQLGTLGKRIVRFRAPISSYFLALTAPLAWIMGAWLLRDLFGAPTFRIDIFPQLAVFAALWLVFAFGEEIGWRGYALPILNSTFGFWRAATILGIIWAVWHYPKLLSSPYVESLDQAAPFIGLFTLQIVLANYFICWLFLRSNLSVVIAALFHASFNTVATAYSNAAIDYYVTAAIGACVLLIFIFERRVEAEES